MSFDYTERIKDNTIILRAKKNGKIISIPIHNKLAPVLDYIKENKPNMTEVNIRRNIKEICTLIGINRNIKFHTARHTFAMQLRVKGFSIDEIAELLGDTVEVARVYAQMYSPALNNAILKAFE